VQHQLGDMKGRRSSGAEGESVKVELQADCYAGVWAHYTAERKLLESGDIEEAIEAASAVGDDRLAEGAGKPVRPETWTHGSAASRAAAFKKGFGSGNPGDCQP
jgi:predicted metalloprotease